MNSIYGETKSRMKCGAVDRTLDLVRDTLVSYLAKKVAEETKGVGYKAYFNFLINKRGWIQSILHFPYQLPKTNLKQNLLVI